MDNNQEETLYKFWEDHHLFTADPQSERPSYSLLMPPPNLTGDLHLGHAMQHSILDAIARFKRMQGFDVLLLPGVDHAGIQFEGTLNKLLEKEGLSKYKLGREEWLKRAWAFKDQIYASFHSTWKVMGISADWSREVFTIEEKVQKGVLEEFSRFWQQDLLYKGAYIVQWCPKCGTAIEDLEMEYQERTEKLYFVKYQVVDQPDEYITVATARPETIFADVAIAVYPDHPLYKKFIGKKAANPLASKENSLLLEIFEDARVDKEFGTGALKITPGHDPLDYEIGKDHELPILHAVDKSGKTTDLTGDLAGLKVIEAREKAAQRLTELGAIEKQEDYTHSVPVCERCKTTVEPLISQEWFVKMEPLAKKALQKIGEIKFYPANYQQILSDWVENIHDWSISRSLWWGHRIPVWYCQRCNPNHLVGKDKDMVISWDHPQKACQSCGEDHWVQDEQVLDTWFSSGLWPLVTLGWPGDEWGTMKKYYPHSFELSSGEIKYLWIARMIMLGVWFEDQIPFLNMFFHGQLRDLQGRKFSKSLGNGIDPNQLRSDWGTDAARMALYSYSAPGRDGRANKQTMDERAKNYRNFTTKLRNIYKFVFELAPSERIEDKQNSDDQWILAELKKLVTETSKNIESFQLHLAAENLYNFSWHILADVYLEKSKTRRSEAQPTLEKVLTTLLVLLHPFMPFVTEELYQKLPNKNKLSIMQEPWPNLEN